MQESALPGTLRDSSLYFVGIKGTGMAALAELVSIKGATVTGSDSAETFPTQETLDSLGIRYFEEFAVANLPQSADALVYSAAYDPATHPEIVEAKRRGIPVLSYTRALGCISTLQESNGISGTNGKTTTTAMTAALIKATGLPGTVMVPAVVPCIGGRTVYSGGDRFFITETCEYRRHFLDFHPARIVVTNVELDHTDYFTGLSDVLDAFAAYAGRLPPGGALIYCADDPGAAGLAERVREARADIRLVPYGKNAAGVFGITGIAPAAGRTDFRLRGWDTAFGIRVAGMHNVLNAAAAVSLTVDIAEAVGIPAGRPFMKAVAEGLNSFTGSKRRAEVVWEGRGVTILDDYAHHPSAIKTTLEGFRAFYPGRRIVADFMPHLYTRTRDLFREFVGSFGAADTVVLHEIYGSAREKSGDISGRALYDAVKAEGKDVHFFPGVDDALDFCASFVKPGDVFVTMGAGDNWRLGRALVDRLGGKEG